MSKVSFNLTAEPRNKVGKNTTKKLRRENKLPAILYGPKLKNNIPISIKYNEFDKLFRQAGKHHLISLQLGEEKYDVIVKDYKFHPVTRDFLHIDFLVTSPSTPFITEVPVRYVGTPIGVKEGGTMFIFTKKLIIRTTPELLPEAIEVDISHLQLKQYMIVREIKTTGDYNIMTNEGNVLVEIK